MPKIYDTVIIGGGPAGLSAALILGRSRRKVLLLDSGQYRNKDSHGVHGFFSRDGILPQDLLAVGREQLTPYGIEFQCVAATSAKHTIDFEIELENGTTVHSRTLLLATGVVDRLPEFPGVEECYGKSVHHCPYCDGWEWSDQPIAVFGDGDAGIALSAKLINWSHDIALCTNSRNPYSSDVQRELKNKGITLYEQGIDRLVHSNGLLEKIVFRDNLELERRAIFFTSGQDQRCSIAESLGCNMTEKGVADTGEVQNTNIPGLFVAGDAAKDMQFAIVAAAEGAKAAVAINEAFIELEFKRLMNAQ